MYCPYCNWDYPNSYEFEMTGEWVCPGCGRKYGLTRGWSHDDAHHETGSDAAEDDSLKESLDD